MSDIAYLITETYTFDDIGNNIAIRDETQIFVEVSSVSQSEFFSAGQSGLKPEYKLSTFAGNYDGQEKIKYRDVVYNIYRTYQKNDEMVELYLTKKVGA